VKKPSKRRVDKRETTLTVENPQADLYKKKGKKTAAVRDDGGLELPSYGMHLVETEENDDCSIFMHRAEEAEQRELQKRSKSSAGASRKKGGDKAVGAAEEKQDSAPKDSPKRSKRRGASGRGESPRAEKPKSTDPKGAEPKAASTPERDGIADFLAAVRAKVTGKLRQFGFSDEWIRQRVPRRDSVEDAMKLLSALLDARLRLVDSESAARPSGAAVKEAAGAKDTSRTREKQARPARGAAQAEPVDPAPAEQTNPFEGFEFDSVVSPVSEPTEEPAAAPQPESVPERPARKDRPARKTKKAKRRLPIEDTEELSAEPAPSAAPSPSAEPAPFGGLELSEAMLSALRDAAYTTPTPIQKETIPRIFAGVDLLGQSKTGSGKTAAFMIPIIEQVYSCEKGDAPVALVVVPTRELAVQIRDETVKLSSNFEIVTVACYGGKPIADQIRKMSRGVDIVIGTPGRILDLSNAARWI
ncbi:MAG: DEAD/DEAH box helicase, partial [Thermoguttaceae bacterium]|nr:DEAD/DEAH box helicase [Thermoguttaceae bacterium]